MRLNWKISVAIWAVFLVFTPNSEAHALDCTAILREGRTVTTHIVTGDTELLYKMEVEKSAQIELHSSFYIASASDYARFKLEDDHGRVYDLGEVHNGANSLSANPISVPAGNYYIRVTFEPCRSSSSWLNIRYSTVSGSEYWGEQHSYSYEFEDNNDPVSANLVNTNPNIFGAVLNYQESDRGLGYTDVDFYKLKVSKTGNVLLDCWAYPDVEFTLLDASGNQMRINASQDNAPCTLTIEGDRGLTGYAGLNCGILPAGNYYLRVSGKHTSAEGSSYRIGWYQASSMFRDITEQTPHATDVDWLCAESISVGWDTEQGLEYRPFAEVARCDMAAFLYRLAGSPDYEPSSSDWSRFSDVSNATPHAKEILWLASTGVSTGYPDGTFKPFTTVTRCDMAAFLHRMAGDSSAAGTQSFSDVDGRTPHADHIRWLASEGVSTGFPNGSFKPFGTVVRCDMAAFLHRMQGKVML